MTSRILIAAACALALAAAGCGNKGPLYLPKRPAPTTTGSAPAEAKPADDSNKAGEAAAKP